MVAITGVLKGSSAERQGIKVGDLLISVNGHTITDILDYRFYLCEKKLSVLLCREGKEYTVNIKKDEYKKNFGAELFDIIDDPIDISSTELRLMLEKNLDVSKYIPQKVIKYISDNNLYKGK
jgi:NifB/MoaA-like Fe-S oxidoreductase